MSMCRCIGCGDIIDTDFTEGVICEDCDFGLEMSVLSDVKTSSQYGRAESLKEINKILDLF